MRKQSHICCKEKKRNKTRELQSSKVKSTGMDIKATNTSMVIKVWKNNNQLIIILVTYMFAVKGRARSNLKDCNVGYTDTYLCPLFAKFDKSQNKYEINHLFLYLEIQS